MQGFKATISQFCTDYWREDSDDSYGSWGESYSNRFEKLELTESYPDIVSSLNFKSGENALVVWVQYSTGDSFGRSDGGAVEAIGVFKDYKAACELSAAVELANKNNSNKIEITTSDGQEFNIYANWSGYFEDLDSVEIDSVIIR